VVAAALVLILAFPSALRLHLGSQDSLSKATSGRADLIKGGVDLARDRPLTGWGSGTFRREYRRHEHSSGREATSASHTIPITVAAEQGIVGLAVYVAVLVLALRRLLRGARGNPARAVIGAGFAALLLHTWVYAAFLEDPMTWTLLALGTALATPAAVARRTSPAGAAARNGRPHEPVVAAPTAPWRWRCGVPRPSRAASPPRSSGRARRSSSRRRSSSGR
jgi:O-antigen ligase